MAFVEDLSPFFALTDFGVSAAITRGAVPVVTCNVIFDQPTQPIGIYEQEVEEALPRATGRTADLDAVRRGDRVTVSAVAYRIERIRHDGTGVTVLHLAVL